MFIEINCDFGCLVGYSQRSGFEESRMINCGASVVVLKSVTGFLLLISCSKELVANSPISKAGCLMMDKEGSTSSVRSELEKPNSAISFGTFIFFAFSVR